MRRVNPMPCIISELTNLHAWKSGQTASVEPTESLIYTSSYLIGPVTTGVQL